MIKREAFGYLEPRIGCNTRDEAYISVAREQTTDDLEVDDIPLVSEGEGGCFVQAWLWVSDSEIGVTDD